MGQDQVGQASLCQKEQRLMEKIKGIFLQLLKNRINCRSIKSRKMFPMKVLKDILLCIMSILCNANTTFIPRISFV